MTLIDQVRAAVRNQPGNQVFTAQMLTAIVNEDIPIEDGQYTSDQVSRALRTLYRDRMSGLRRAGNGRYVMAGRRV